MTKQIQPTSKSAKGSPMQDVNHEPMSDVQVICEALGEASALFMGQGDTRADDIVMPASELEGIALRTVVRLKALVARGGCSRCGRAADTWVEKP